MKKSAILTLSMGFLLLFTWHIQAIDTPEAREHATKIRALALSYATVNNIEIAYKVIGEDDHPAVLLIMGLGASHILWGDNLVMQLVDAGYRIVLFDNRDTGDSQRLEEFGQPLLWWQLLKARFGFDVDADYTLEDMAQDSVALLDELDIEQAHIVGASMGGMIAQAVASNHPSRVLSLVSIMSTPGVGDHLPPPSTEANDQLTNMAKDKVDNKARLRQLGIYTESMPRQIMAVIKSGDRTEAVKTISAPTLVIHGVDDPLIPLPHGEYTAALIKESKFVALEGMAHNIPPQILPKILSHMVQHFETADRIALSNLESIESLP